MHKMHLIFKKRSILILNLYLIVHRIIIHLMNSVYLGRNRLRTASEIDRPHLVRTAAAINFAIATIIIINFQEAERSSATLWFGTTLRRRLPCIIACSTIRFPYVLTCLMRRACNERTRCFTLPLISRAPGNITYNMSIMPRIVRHYAMRGLERRFSRLNPNRIRNSTFSMQMQIDLGIDSPFVHSYV